MEVAKVTSKGQITIPISIRRKLEINEGDKVLFIYKPEGIMMVNPNLMQGGASGDVIEAAETEMASEAIAAMKQRETEKPERPAAAVSAPVSVPVTAPIQTQTFSSAPAQQDEPDDNSYTEKTIASVPIPPAAAEELEPQKDKHLGGFNLSTLLDDIRSIGSNI